MACCATYHNRPNSKNKQTQTLPVRPALTEIQTVPPIPRRRFRTPEATTKSHAT
ncbi:hypothetical protein B0H65DRAFT_415771 [Neurospora tetraspora]|uniref:Uncharacterized protein n=1 Tax=Neurospora tetraspora TaxID=94610 RepID=A0AAE0JNU5_9PEZI|nr:hypothetical protein B0H65DRAFT_415771 [Neurospora tetraspora]